MTATTAQLASLRAHAVDDQTRAIARDGIVLDYDQADSLGASTLDWMRKRLSLTIVEDDRGVVCTSGYESMERPGDRNEI